MRIAYVSADPGVPVFGHKGCSTHVQEVIKGMRRRGVEVVLWAARIGGEAPAELRDVTLHELPRAATHEPALRERCAIEANACLLEQLHSAGPFTAVYERYSLWGYGGMEYARGSGIPGVLEINAPLIDEQKRYRGLVHEEQAEQIAAWALHAASHIVTVSQEVSDYARRWQVADDKIHVIPNGVDPDRFTPRQTLHSNANGRHDTPSRPATHEDRCDVSGDAAWTIGFVGTLKPWHGVDTLIKAFCQYHHRNPAARLLVVGDGPEREQLGQLVRQAGRAVAESVTWTGAVSPDEIPAYLRRMDVAVAPYPLSGDFYFSPLKLFEYMAVGLPVVASDIGQIRTVVRHGENGLLVTPGSPEALVAAWDELYQHATWARQLGVTARRSVLRHHTWERAVDRILSLCQPAPVCTADTPS